MEHNVVLMLHGWLETALGKIEAERRCTRVDLADEQIRRLNSDPQYARRLLEYAAKLDARWSEGLPEDIWPADPIECFGVAIIRAEQFDAVIEKLVLEEDEELLDYWKG